MFNKSFIFFIFFISTMSFAKNSKVNAIESSSKVYEVKKDNPGLNFPVEIDDDEDVPNDGKSIFTLGKKKYIEIGITRTELNWSKETLLNKTDGFSQNSVGVKIGNKIEVNLLHLQGNLTYSLEWDFFTRKSGTNEQNLHLLQLDLLQYFRLFDVKKYHLDFNFGAGLSPLLVVTNQSAISDSSFDATILGTLALNSQYRINRKSENIKMLNDIFLTFTTTFGRLDHKSINKFGATIGVDLVW